MQRLYLDFVHDLRAAYAYERYKQLTGSTAPQVARLCRASEQHGADRGT